MLNQLRCGSGSDEAIQWNPDKKGRYIEVRDDRLTAKHTSSKSWACVLSEQTFSEGVHYIELEIQIYEPNDGRRAPPSKALCLGVASISYSKVRGRLRDKHCWALQADGEMFHNGKPFTQMDGFGSEDRIGMLIDMDNKNLTFWKNGSKLNASPLSMAGVEEVHILACLGGYRQFVTINNEPEIPDEVQDILSKEANKPAEVDEEEKKADETEEEHKEDIPKKLSNILKNSKFDCINEEMGEVTPTVASVWVLVFLSKMSEDYFAPFKLNEKTAPEREKNTKTLDIAEKLTGKVLHWMQNGSHRDGDFILKADGKCTMNGSNGTWKSVDINTISVDFNGYEYVFQFNESGSEGTCIKATEERMRRVRIKNPT